MPLDFVRYTPEIETIDPNLDRIMEQIIDFWEKTVRESPVVEGSGRAVRGAMRDLPMLDSGKGERLPLTRRLRDRTERVLALAFDGGR